MNPEEFDFILELKRQSIPIWKQIVIVQRKWSSPMYLHPKIGKNKPNMTKNCIKNSTVTETEKNNRIQHCLFLH